MAVSTLSYPINYNIVGALGAHNFMLALHAHMEKVGLSRVSTGADYNVAGDETQLTATDGAYSGWLAYNFTDPAQSAYPITIWIRLQYGWYGSQHTSSRTFCVQVRVSEGVSIGGAPLGANLEAFCNNLTALAANNPPQFNTSLGDYVRYSGDALTLIMGMNGFKVGFGSARGSLIELHIERRYSVTTFEVQRGFSGWVQTPPGCVAPPQWVAGGISWSETAQIGGAVTSYVSSTEAGHWFFTRAYERPTHALLRENAGAGVVAPIHTLDGLGRTTTFGKLFTAPKSLFPSGGIFTLDFAGQERPYLACNPSSTEMYSSLFCHLFEWEL